LFNIREKKSTGRSPYWFINVAEMALSEASVSNVMEDHQSRQEWLKKDLFLT